MGFNMELKVEERGEQAGQMKEGDENLKTGRGYSRMNDCQLTY